jgi:hypothetical protein
MPTSMRALDMLTSLHRLQRDDEEEVACTGYSVISAKVTSQQGAPNWPSAFFGKIGYKTNICYTFPVAYF